MALPRPNFPYVHTVFGKIWPNRMVPSFGIGALPCGKSWIGHYSCNLVISALGSEMHHVISLGTLVDLNLESVWEHL